MSGTLLDRIWDEHVVSSSPGDPDLMYIDMHLVHEVSSPQAFDALRGAGLRVRRPDLTLATEDHNVPTDYGDKFQGLAGVRDESSRLQLATLRRNCREFGIRLYSIGSSHQGIVHVIAPELGLTQPGMIIVCGDSHTSTLGAFGCLAFGVGTSQVEHVLATQTLPLVRPQTMSVEMTGHLRQGVTPKDAILALISKIGVSGGQGCMVEYRGDGIEGMSMEGRMTICNMTIEYGARVGIVAPDETTFEYLRGRQESPAGEGWARAVEYWKTLRTEAQPSFDKYVDLDLSTLSPYVTWGTNPGQSSPIDASVPDPASFEGDAARASAQRALEYMDLRPGMRIRDIQVDTVFLGSCTNGRIDDLRAAAAVLRGRTVAPGVRMLVVPGSEQVRLAAEREGLASIFSKAGAEWRHSGCSLCLGLNPDRLRPGQRCASTSNRNFEGRQGRGGRTHLVSPMVAAATAVRGHIAAPYDL